MRLWPYALPTLAPVAMATAPTQPAPTVVPKHTAVKPFKFDGDAEMFQVWLTNFEMWAESQNLSDVQRMHVMPGYIDGKVQMELGYDTTEAWPTSYAAFKDQMKERYDGAGHAYAAEFTKSDRRR